MSIASRSAAVAACLALVFTVAARAANLENEMAAVERIRGLRFIRPVATVEIDRAELPARLRALTAKGLNYSPDEWATVLRALLLLEAEGGDPMDELIDLYNAQVLAYYDPVTRTFYTVRQLPEALKQLPPALAPEEGILVHELMHALQDQRFSIGRRDLALRHDTDANLAYHAFLEGEASLVMLAYMLEKMGAPFEEMIRSPLVSTLLASATTADLSQAPRYFAELLKFPYIGGLRFVLEAYRRGGWKELDAIHERPPTSTRQILHPQEYFTAASGQPWLGAVRTRADSTVVEHLGEFHWAFLVGAENAEGWLDDQVVIGRDAFCHPIVKVETRWESDVAARRFFDAYLALLERRRIGAIAFLDEKGVRVTYLP